VAADAVQGDVELVAAGHAASGAHRHGAGGPHREHMGADQQLRLGHPVVEAVVDHGLGALDQLFRRLGDQHQGAGPGVAGLSHHFGDAQQPADVGVVAAGVGDVGFAAVIERDLLAAGVVQAGVLLHRQAVHVAAEHHHRAVAVFQHRRHAGAADAGVHLVAQFFEALADQFGGFGLLEAQFRVGVQVFEGAHQAVGLGFGQFGDALGGVGQGGGGHCGEYEDRREGSAM